VSYDDLAALFLYPNLDGVDRVRSAAEAVGDLGPFAERIAAGPPEDLEEYFTRTFDINPVVSLELGWHLYGEDYSRGAFLVHMRGLMRDHGVNEGAELSDHLTSALRVLGHMDGKAAAELARGYVLPAIAKILGALEGKHNDYSLPLERVQRFLREQHGQEEEAAEVGSQPYMCGGCGNE